MSTYFKIARGIKIDNHKLDQPIFINVQVSGTLAIAGSSSFYVTHVSPAETSVKVTLALERGDVLVMTNSSNQTEHVVVDYCNQVGLSYQIVIQGTLTYSYTTGDNVYGYGTGWPAGFNHSSAAWDNFSFTTIKPTAEGGYGKNYSFRTRLTSSLGSGILSSDAFSTEVFEEMCSYRMGVWHKKWPNSSNDRMRLSFYDGKDSYYGDHDYAQYLDWTELTLSGAGAVTSDDLSTGTTSYGDMTIYFYAASFIDAYIDSIYLEHARGLTPTLESPRTGLVSNGSMMYILTDWDLISDFTDPSTATVPITVWGYDSNRLNVQGQSGYLFQRIQQGTQGYLVLSSLTPGTQWDSGFRVEEVGNGYYTFTEYPDMVRGWKKIVPINKRRTSGNNLVWYNTSGWGERATKYGLEMRFSDVAYTFYQKLRKCEEYCERGEVMNLHEIADNYKEFGFDFLQGKVEIHDVRHNIWDPEKVSFTFVIEEV